MASELALVATAVISSMAALAGVALTWALGNISAESKDRRAERELVRHRLEDKYVQVLAEIDLYLRLPGNTPGIIERLAHTGAAVGVFAGDDVSSKYEDLVKEIEDCELLHGRDMERSLFERRLTILVPWARITTKKANLVCAMQSETRRMRNFS